MSAQQPLCVLIAAMGGQGGGVLVDWLVGAARHAGFPAQATSIPGVAQRTGATTYYFELYPARDAPGDPVFCLFPSGGDVDLMVALEPTEAGRALERGFVTEHTTVITSARRLYSTAEKSVASDGGLDPAIVLHALDAAAANLYRMDPPAHEDVRLNALMFGAIAATGILPLEAEDYRNGIEQGGVAVEANLAGFERGREALSAPPSIATQAPGLSYQRPPAGFETEIERFPETLRSLVGHALARLVDYQDPAYVKLYLERLQAVVALERDDDENREDYPLSATVARRLGAWMSYEDLIRVAQLKTRPGRLARIRAELDAEAGEPVAIRDFFKPRRQEIAAVLPSVFARIVSRRDLRPDRAGTGLALRWPTFTVLGFAALRMLAGMRFLRRWSYGYATEQAAIERWLAAVRFAAAHDLDLARRCAKLALWARGYGEVRARGMARIDALLSDFSARVVKDPEGLRRDLDAALDAARHDPDRNSVPVAGPVIATRATR